MRKVQVWLYGRHKPEEDLQILLFKTCPERGEFWQPVTGGVEEATAMVMDIRENHHVFCSIVVYPVIPKGHIIYRLIPTALHTDEDIEATLKAFEETKQKLDAGEYQADQIPDMAEVVPAKGEPATNKAKRK